MAEPMGDLADVVHALRRIDGCVNLALGVLRNQTTIREHERKMMVGWLEKAAADEQALAKAVLAGRLTLHG